MKHLILTLALLGTTFAAASQTPVTITNSDGATYNELYTESSWQALSLDAATLGLTGANGQDVTGKLTLTDDAGGLDVTLDAATLDGSRVVLNVTLERADTSVALNTPVRFTVTNTATGASTTFSAPVLGAAEIDPATIQTVWIDE